LRPDAFAKVLARIDSSRQTPAGSGPTSGIIDPGVPVPDALRGYKLGPWTFAGPGLKMSKIATNPSDRSKLFLLKAAPGASLSQHGHGGEELICVLKGSFRDDAGTYRPGDVASADASIEHRPQVSDDGDCICLVALEGGLRLRSVIGRILQPVLGF